MKGRFETPAQLLAHFFAILGPAFHQKLYLIIDEYDEFATSLLGHSPAEFQAVTSACGFLKDIYSQLKEAARGPVARIFMTGVTAIPLDSLTSSFSLAVDLTNDVAFATLCGFTSDELRRLIPQLVDLSACGLTLEEVFARMKAWCDGYRFSPQSTETVFNASVCLYYLNYLRLENHEPDSLLDPAFAPELSKLAVFLRLGRRDFVKSVVEKALRREPIAFTLKQCKPLRLNRRDGFNAPDLLVALVCLGCLTFAPAKEASLVVPNRVVAAQFFQHYLKHILKAKRTGLSWPAFQDAFDAMATSDPAPFFHLVCDRFDEKSGLHSHLHLQESDFQTLLFAGLLFTNRFHTELEVKIRGLKKGYADLVICPAIGSDGRYSYVVELKHLTKAEAAVSGAVDKALAAAKRQATKYAKGENLQSLPPLKRVAAVFVGTTLERLSVL